MTIDPRGALVVFARAPSHEPVKTRLGLAPPVAKRLYLAFLDDTLALARGLDVRKLVLATARDPLVDELARAHEFETGAQAAGDLGAKMERAIDGELARGGPVIVIGSDAPTLPREHLRAALDALARHELVLGPSTDGGYWLVGARRPAPELFDGMSYGHERVLVETLARARGCALLPFWYDVDRPSDLDLLVMHLHHLPDEVAPATRRALAVITSRCE